MDQLFGGVTTPTEDTTSPILSITPSATEVYVSVGESWSLPSVSATDDVDGDITEFVTLDDDNYDLNTTGTYTLTWSVSDTAGNAATLSLTLYVYDNNGGNNDTFYSEDAYYSSLNGLSGSSLEDALYTLINNTGTYTTTTYGEARDYLAISDVLTTDNTKLDMIYSTTLSSGSYALASWDSGATWNREHVWAKSLLGNGYDVDNGDRGIAADLHNLRAADTGINSSRGNKLFSASTTLIGAYGDDGSGRWYPGDSYIGDVARIIFYMDIRWGSETSISSIGTLATFISWASTDVVDTFEENRNDVIYSYQGNRNPFIDHPELVDLIYG